MGDGGELIPPAHSIWPVREEARGGAVAEAFH